MASAAPSAPERRCTRTRRNRSLRPECSGAVKKYFGGCPADCGERWGSCLGTVQRSNRFYEGWTWDLLRRERVAISVGRSGCFELCWRGREDGALRARPTPPRFFTALRSNVRRRASSPSGVVLARSTRSRTSGGNSATPTTAPTIDQARSPMVARSPTRAASRQTRHGSSGHIKAKAKAAGIASCI